MSRRAVGLSVKAHELAIKLTFISEPVKSVWTSASKYTGGQYGVLASPKAEYSSFEPISEFIFFFWRLTLSYSSRSAVFPFAAFDVPPRAQYDISEVSPKMLRE